MFFINQVPLIFGNTGQKTVFSITIWVIDFVKRLRAVVKLETVWLNFITDHTNRHHHWFSNVKYNQEPYPIMICKPVHSTWVLGSARSLLPVSQLAKPCAWCLKIKQKIFSRRQGEFWYAKERFGMCFKWLVASPLSHGIVSGNQCCVQDGIGWLRYAVRHCLAHTVLRSVCTGLTHCLGTSSKRMRLSIASSCRVTMATGAAWLKSNWKWTPAGGSRRKFRRSWTERGGRQREGEGGTLWRKWGQEQRKKEMNSTFSMVLFSL